MIQTALNGMITLVLAKFVINDMPHAAGLLGNPTTSVHFQRTEYTWGVNKKIYDYYEDLPVSEDVEEALGLLGRDLYFHEGSPMLICRGPKNEPLGYAVYEVGYNYRFKEDVLFIISLGSLTDEPGTGRALINELKRRAKYRGLSIITVVLQHEGLIPFYEKMGFVEYPGIKLAMICRFRGE